jgi:L-rhamnose isomerase
VSNLRNKRGVVVICLSVAIALVTSGCTWVKVSENGEGVRVLEADQIADCELIRKTRSMTTTKILFIPRNKEKVLSEQTTLARNEAAGLGGNAVAVMGEPDGNAQRFGVYDCPAE